MDPEGRMIAGRTARRKVLPTSESTQLARTVFALPSLNKRKNSRRKLLETRAMSRVR
jgi:hypothetical protein